MRGYQKILEASSVLLLDKITEALKLVRDSKSSDLSQILALVSADSELGNANLWK